MLIFCGSHETYESLINKDFGNKRIIELKAKESECIIVLKGANFDDLKHHMEELQQNGVKDIKEIKSFKPNTVINKVKLVCNDPNTANQLLKNGIKLSYILYKTEELKQLPRIIQCFKCQGFGHLAKECRKDKPVCATCGKSDHKLDDKNKPICESSTRFCVNCKGDHSSAYSKCPKKIEKIDLFNKELVNKNIITRTNQTVKYADIVKTGTAKGVPTTFEKTLLEKLENITNICNDNSNKITSTSEHHDKLMKNMHEISVSLDEIKSSIQKNANEINILNEKLEDLKKKGENNFSTNKQYLQKVIERFIDFYYICNPKSNYDESTIKSLKYFINDLGLNKDEIFINDRLKKIHRIPAAATTSTSSSNQSRKSTSSITISRSQI